MIVIVTSLNGIDDKLTKQASRRLSIIESLGEFTARERGIELNLYMCRRSSFACEMLARGWPASVYAYCSLQKFLCSIEESRSLGFSNNKSPAKYSYPFCHLSNFVFYPHPSSHPFKRTDISIKWFVVVYIHYIITN